MGSLTVGVEEVVVGVVVQAGEHHLGFEIALMAAVLKALVSLCREAP